MVEPHIILAGFLKLWTYVKAFLIGLGILILADRIVNSGSRQRNRRKR